jgi:putative SOS response-associated peptidase YedK
LKSCPGQDLRHSSKTENRKRRKIEGEYQLFGFLTTDANAEVGAIHPKAMPVILTTEAEIEQWMTASADEALKLQRPHPNGFLKIVAAGSEGKSVRAFDIDKIAAVTDDLSRE